MVDLTRFPFNGLTSPGAATLTEAITTDAVDSGFVVVTLKAGEASDLAPQVRAFAQEVRTTADESGLTDITAYRQLRRQEMGGAIPFDQAFCEELLDDIAARRTSQQDRFPGLASADRFVLGNEIADWVLLVTFESSVQAAEATASWRAGDAAFAAVSGGVQAFTVNAFRNTKRYAQVSLDPDVIQFFNLFPGPGDPGELWTQWQAVLPRYFDAAEIRSSFPLQALDPEQSLILVNYAHADSVKHFLLSMVFDPNFLEDIARCYTAHGFGFPHPFFCKVVPV